MEVTQRPIQKSLNFFNNLEEKKTPDALEIGYHRIKIIQMKPRGPNTV